MCCKPPKQLKATASPITWCPHATASTNMVCSSCNKSTVPRSRKPAFAVSESVWEVAIVCVADFDPEEEAEEIRDAVRQYAIEKGCELKIQKSAFIAEVSKRVRQDSLYRDDDSADDSEDDSDPRSAGWMDVEQQV